jgi:hypothetical protein
MHPATEQRHPDESRLLQRTSNSLHFYLAGSVYKVDEQKSIPAQTRQLIDYVNNNKG